MYSFCNISVERLLEQLQMLFHFILCLPVWLSSIVELNLGTMPSLWVVQSFYTSFFGEGEERNHRVCRNGGSVQRFRREVLCNPMLNSASDLLRSCVKPVCFSCLYFSCTPQKMMIAHGFSARSPSRQNVLGC